MSTSPDLKAAYTQETIRGVMAGYVARWGAEPIEAVEVEGQFHLPIVNLKTGRKSRTMTNAGKRDVIVRWKGKLYGMDHKTTSEDFSDPAGSFWQRLTLDSQISNYMLSAHQEGKALAGMIWDVIKRPSIKPKKIVKKSKAGVGDVEEIETYGTYYGTYISHRSPPDFETPEFFGARVKHETIANPDKYFARRPIPRLDADLIEFGKKLWDIATDIREKRRNKRWHKNDGACFNFSTACPYLPLCSGCSEIESSEWRRRKQCHSELEGVGYGALTASSMKLFQACPKKYYYRHELGIEPNVEHTSEALYFGTALHAELEAWWNLRKEDVS